MKRRLEILMVLAAVVFCLSVQVNAAEPVAHWKLDEPDGTIAYDSAGDNDGTLMNGPVWTTGWIDGALEFDGVNDYVHCGSSSVFKILGDMAVSFWFNREQTWLESPTLVAIEEGAGDPENAVFYARILYGSSSLADIKYSHEYGGGLNQDYNFNVDIGLGCWTHIVIVRDSYQKKVRAYKDGVLVDTFSYTYNPTVVSDELVTTIGGRSDLASHRFLKGLIDDVRVYNQALSAEEIQQLYEEGLPDVVGLDITGPNEAAEDSQTQYSAIALYDNDSTADVTDLATWWVEPSGIASIDTGLLQTQDLDDPEEITIYAEYTEGDITVDANKPVSVFEICRRGSAMEFDGLNDYVNLSENAVTTTEFTVAAWANQYGEGGGIEKNNRIFSQRDNSVGDNRSGIGLHTDNGSHAAAGIRSDSGSTQVLYAPRKPYGEWHHYAMTVDSEDFIFYIDGVEVSRTSNNQSGVYTTSIDHVYIGRYMYSGLLKGSFNGAMDDVRIYDRALSAEEIQMIMHTRPEIDEPNLVGYWDFDEGEGQVAYDMSGSGNDGQLGSGPDADDSDPNWVDPDAPIGICNPPIANAGPDQTVYVDANCMTLVTLDGSDSNDPDGDELTYAWVMDGVEIATGVSPTVELSSGEYFIELIVTDSFNDSGSDEVVVSVKDDIPPEFILTVEPEVLKPHNHEMVLITPVWDVNDNCDDEVEVSLLSITSSQADDGIGDGHTTDDILITDEGLIYLRAEISDSSEGRIYTLTFEAVDDSGNSNVQSAIVVVAVEQLWRHREGK